MPSATESLSLDARRNLRCSSENCNESFITVIDGQTADGIDVLDQHVRNAVWEHMQSMHSDIFVKIYRSEEVQLKSKFISNNEKVSLFLSLSLYLSVVKSCK